MRRKNPVHAGLAFALPAAVAALLAPASAHAYEHQWHIGGTFGYAGLIDGSTSNGFGGGAYLAYGLNDSFNLMAEIDVTEHPSGHLLALSGAVGAGYVFDVLQWVPYAGLLIGPAGLLDTACTPSTIGPCRAFRFSAEVPFGIDYQLTRSFALGLGGRVQLLLPAPSPSPWLLVAAFARAEYVWGY